MQFMTEDFCKKHLYPLLLTLLSSIGSLSLFCTFFGLTTSLLWFTALFPLLLLPIHFLTVNGRPLLFFLIFSPFAALVFFMVVRAAGSTSALILAYTEWWNDNSSELFPPFSFILLLPILLCISLLYLLQCSYWSRLAATLLQTALLLTLRFLGYKTGKASVVCFLGYFLFLLIETTFYLFLRKEPSDVSLTTDIRHKKIPAFTVQLWPVVFVAMLTLSVLPYGRTPIRWNVVYNIWNTVTSTANDVFQFVRIELLNFSSDFSLKFSGYDNSGVLGGEILKTYKDSIYVRGNSRVTDSVYLNGNSKNIYTGSSWESDLTIPDKLEAYSDAYLDAAELAYAVARYGSYKNHDNLYLNNWHELRFLDYRSTTLFSSAKTKRIEVIFPGNGTFTTDPDAFRFQRSMKEDTQYRTYFNQLNLGSSEFLALATSSVYDYDNSYSPVTTDFQLFSADYHTLPRDEKLDELFRIRKETIRTNYLALPSSVPYRVYELAISLTEGIDSDYEKMLALENYLKQFQYTTLPDELPKDRDLIDYFLFDNPEGYCTYFATALSVLGRCIGIPTRYVQGYCTRASENSSEWIIRSNNAHAWTEAYIDGLGWIPLDATPGYESLRYQPWHKKEKAVPTPAPSGDRPHWWSEMQQDEEPVPTQPLEPQQNTNLLLGMTILLCSTVALLLLFLIYILYRKFRLERFLRNAPPEERFYYEATQIFLLTGLLCGNNKKETLFAFVTLTEFTESFVQQYAEIEKHAYHFCEDYSKVRYGMHPATQELCTFALQYKSELLLLLAHEKGKRAVALYRTGELLRY